MPPLDPSARVADKAAAFKGIKSAFPIESFGIDSAEEMVNYVLKDGQLAKVNGCVTYADVLDGQVGGITSLHFFKNLIAAQRGTSVVLEELEASAIFQEVFSGLGSVSRMYSATWRDRLFLTNGVETKFILNRLNEALDVDYHKGDLGMDPPPNGNPPPGGGSGYPNFSDDVIVTEDTPGQIAPGSYYYFISVLDEETNTESPMCGAVMNQDGFYELSPNVQPWGPRDLPFVVTAGSNRDVVFDYTTLLAYLDAVKQINPRASHFIIYRATKTGDLFNTPFLVPYGGTVSTPVSIEEFRANGVDFRDTTPTGDLPAISPPENNFPPPNLSRFQLARTRMFTPGSTTAPLVESEHSGFTHLRSFRDQIFGFGARSVGWSRDSDNFPGERARGVNAFSDILFGSEVYQPDYFPYMWEVGRGDGQESVGLGVMGDLALLAFKKKSTYYLSGSAPTDFVLRIMDTRRGAVHRSTIQETPNGVITLDRGGFLLWNKIGLGEQISDSIQDVIDSILFQYADTFYSCYDVKDDRYYCSVVVPGSQTPNLTLCLDLKTMEWSSSKLRGRARLIETNSDDAYIDIVGHENTGRLLDFSSEDNVTNQGGVIEATWKSGTINFGDDQRKKKMEWIYLRAKSKSGWKVDIEVIPDYDESRKYVLQNWDVVSSQSTWYSSDIATDGSLLWDEGSWASDGKVRSVSKIPIKCTGYTFQIRIINKESDPERSGFTIESVSCEGVKFGR